MREQLNFRERDIELGRIAGRREAKTKGRIEGRIEGRSQAMNAAKQMLQDGKINQEQLEEFVKYMKKEEEKRREADSSQINQD
jgi:predicted transposase YdaD